MSGTGTGIIIEVVPNLLAEVSGADGHTGFTKLSGVGYRVRNKAYRNIRWDIVRPYRAALIGQSTVYTLNESPGTFIEVLPNLSECRVRVGILTQFIEVGGCRYCVYTEPYRSIHHGIEAALNLTEDS